MIQYDFLLIKLHRLKVILKVIVERLRVH